MCHSVEGRHSVKVVSQRKLAEGVFDLLLKAPLVAAKAKPGQFVNLYCNDGIRLLPRPISICEYDKEEGFIRLVYSAIGGGTNFFSTLKEGDSIDILGPLGQGFPLEDVESSYIIGGGIGIPPLLQLAKELKGHKHILLGYRDEIFLLEDFKALDNVSIEVATESGSIGTKGNVLDCKPISQKATIYSCGPMPMLKALQQYGESHQCAGYLSLEERMGCGFGACVGCVCKIRTEDGIQHKKVCVDGPVFKLEEVCFHE